jgi:P-type Ca2+ transporter type 2C
VSVFARVSPLPLQILCINLVTDGPVAPTLGVEPAERGVMQRPPYPPNESIFARALGSHVIWVDIVMAALTLGVGSWYWPGPSLRSSNWKNCCGGTPIGAAAWRSTVGHLHVRPLVEAEDILAGKCSSTN